MTNKAWLALHEIISESSVSFSIHFGLASLIAHVPFCCETSATESHHGRCQRLVQSVLIVDAMNSGRLSSGASPFQVCGGISNMPASIFRLLFF